MSRTEKRDKEITRAIHRLFWRANFQDLPGLVICYLGRIPAMTAFNVLVPLVTAYGIQAILDKNYGLVQHYALLTIGLAFFYVILWGIGSYVVHKNGITGAIYVQNQVFTNFLEKDYEFFGNSFFGSLGTQATRLRDAYINYSELVTLTIPKQIIVVVAGVAVIAYQSFALALMTMTAMVFVLSFTFWSSNWRIQFRRKAWEADSQVAAQIGDALSHGMTVKSFAMEDAEQQRLRGTLDTWGRVRRWAWNSAIPADTGRAFLSTITVAVLLIFSARLYESGTITITMVILVQLYVVKLVAATLEINDIIKRFEEVMGGAYEPVKTMLVARKVQDPQIPKTLQPPYTLQMANVSFHYPDAAAGHDAIRDFSLQMKVGEKVGLVGYSGSGKTTLTKLLLRFMDVTAGRITIGGVDIRALRQTDLRAMISYVPQEPLLFHRSIAENIGYAKPTAKGSDIIAAAKLAYVDEFVDELPNGYDMVVGERGVKLSGGQRQRVAIARAILKDSPILVLDEATSALDSKSEQYIQTALAKLMKSRTALVIAHRLSTIQRMDRIIVMDRGCIVQEGTHQEMLKQPGIYADLWAHQSGGYLGVRQDA